MSDSTDESDTYDDNNADGEYEETEDDDDEEQSSHKELIYLDLRQSVAMVSNGPISDDAVVECDSELKTKLQMFLGLKPARRRLYNPEDNYGEVKEVKEMLPCSRDSLSATASITRRERLFPPLLKERCLRSTNEKQQLMWDDIAKALNAKSFESQVLDKSVDLSYFFSEKQRAQNCEQQKCKRNVSNLLVRHANSYSFVDSLQSETPLKLCHPLAVDYRKQDFKKIKRKLAKTLFNAFNHSIFYCGLHLSIKWQRLLKNRPSRIVHSIKDGGERTSLIILSRRIQQAGILVKALLHEMCHAAAFIYHGETGHDDHCRQWAYRAKMLQPELPQIDDCHDKFKYICLLCHRRAFGDIKFAKEQQLLRCNYCQFQVHVEKANAVFFPNQMATDYKHFVRDNYLKCVESSHSSKMESLNRQYQWKSFASDSLTQSSF
ncbi:hypothetical protein KR215_006240 [Drosophila sulfurigaster]|nr:hypothetical protein KR215_006240 [Drosophila sulfurigaster]